MVDGWWKDSFFGIHGIHKTKREPKVSKGFSFLVVCPCEHVHCNEWTTPIWDCRNRENWGRVGKNRLYVNSPCFLLSVSRNPNHRPQSNTYYLKSQIKLKNKNKIILLLCEFLKKGPFFCPHNPLMMTGMYWIITRKIKS